MYILVSGAIVGHAETSRIWVCRWNTEHIWKLMNDLCMYVQCNSALLSCVGETGSGPSSRNASVERGGERQSDTSDSETTDVRRINQQPFSREGRYDPNRWVFERLLCYKALILLHKNKQWYECFFEKGTLANLSIIMTILHYMTFPFMGYINICRSHMQLYAGLCDWFDAMISGQALQPKGVSYPIDSEWNTLLCLLGHCEIVKWNAQCLKFILNVAQLLTAVIWKQPEWQLENY